ncbi:MAG TPA: multicopper oxidase domain-containing protein [Gemmatimonadaceae bacterium]|nr:multicopper oxidase domain-containing protein [Gemmatimonadaceae bacterium]
MILRAAPVIALSLLGGTESLRDTGAPPPGSEERAVPNDNRIPAGLLSNGVLELELEARAVRWYPETEAGPAIPVYAFAELGQPARIPGPLIRVPAGTEIRVSVRNTLPEPMRLRGLHDLEPGVADSVVVAPGATIRLRLRTSAPGTYYYSGRTGPLPPRPIGGSTRDAPLTGALIVDPPGAVNPPNDRVLVITTWADTLAALGIKSEYADRIMRREGFGRDRWVVMAINGLTWPHTERLHQTVGDTVRWRLISPSVFPHPMHLHGFYFDVDARGDGRLDTLYTPAQRRTVVTEWMLSGTTMAMTWVATRAGNWLFHCHFVPHISDALRLTPATAAGSSAHGAHAEHGMAGLVMGIHVAPARHARQSREPRARRQLRLFVTERPQAWEGHSALSYVLQRGAVPPARDSVLPAGSTLVLRQNEPAQITVINHSTQATAVHWHGIELESFYDGVGGWSGWGTRLAPMLVPGDSFIVRLTPPRAGTFIYHTHASEGTQLAAGLYGALVVHPENARPDTTDRILLFSISGPTDHGLPAINGMPAPQPIELRAGVRHRLRVINIAPLESPRVQIMLQGTVQQWRALAKDGADLPRHRAIWQPAELSPHPGETYDFEMLYARADSLSIVVTSVGTIAARTAARARGLPSSSVPRIVLEVPLLVK